MSEQATCKGCGSCCTEILSITSPEEMIIRQYIAENNIMPMQRFQHSCPFLTDEKNCIIYPVRPMVCRSFFCEDQNSLDGFQKWVGMSLLNMVDMAKTFCEPKS